MEIALFTSFDGRIARRGFWLGFLGMAVVGIAIALGLLAILPSGTGRQIVELVAFGCFCYIWAAVMTKRLHDRNKSAVPYTILFLAPAVLNTLMKIFLIGYTAVNVGGVEVAVPGRPAMVVGFIALAVSLWMIVELGFLRGTAGENRYGPDPLEAGSA